MTAWLAVMLNRRLTDVEAKEVRLNDENHRDSCGTAMSNVVSGLRVLSVNRHGGFFLRLTEVPCRWHILTAADGPTLFW